MPKPGLRKRKLPSNANDEQTTPKAKGRSKKKTNSAVADPLDRLNHDILHILLFYLPVRDIVSCERLSRRWSAFIKEWALKPWSTLRFRHVWKQIQGDENHTRDSAFAAYKREAQHQHNIGSGKLLSGLKLDPPCLISTQGKYVAWRTRMDPDRLCWQSLEPSEEGVCRPSTTFAAQTYFRALRRHPTVANFALSPDGLLLVTYHVRDYRPDLVRKVLVISPTDKKVIWRREYGSRWPRFGLVPLLIGRRWIYCAKMNNGSWDLVAHDFRADKEVYQVPALTRNFSMADPVNDPRDDKQTWDTYRLLPIANGNEIIIELCPSKDQETRCISIINGTTGQLIQKLDFPERELRYLTPDLGGNHFALVSRFPKQDPSRHPTCTWFKNYDMVVIRRFSWSDDGHLSPLPADVIFEPRGYHDVIDYSMYDVDFAVPPLAVEPFTMAVASAIPMSDEPELPLRVRVKWTVRGHHLVPTEEGILYKVARETIRAEITREPLAIDGCFIVSPGENLRLPPRPEIGRHRTEAVCVEEPVEMRFVSGGRLFFQDPESGYLFSF